MIGTVEKIVRSARALETDARRVLMKVESSTERRLTLDTSYAALGELSIKQDNLFKQALRCVENELWRAAHVMAWAAFVDFLHEKLAEGGFAVIKRERKAWHVKAVEDLRNQSEYEIIETARVCNLYGKTIMKALHGLLNKRNECAHPDEYYPALNDTLGYFTELFNRIKYLQGRSVS